MHEFFEHTADLGLRATAPTLPELFAEMGRCLFAAVLDNPFEIRSIDQIELDVPGSNLEDLMFDFLREILYRFEVGGFLSGEFDVQQNENGLHVVIRGEAFDSARHVLSHEVKAVTYHELKVVQDDQSWLAEVIVDI